MTTLKPGSQGVVWEKGVICYTGQLKLYTRMFILTGQCNKSFLPTSPVCVSLFLFASHLYLLESFDLYFCCDLSFIWLLI